MRKLLVLMVSVLLSALFLASCGQVDGQQLAKKSVSDVTENIYYGANDTYSAEMLDVRREMPYAIDGVCGTMTDYFMIRVSALKEDCKAESLEYQFIAGGTKFEGVLQKSKYRNSYTIELKKNIDCGNGVTLTIKNGEDTQTLECATVLKEGMLRSEDALTKLLEKYTDKITAMTEEKDMKGEIVLRLMNNKAETGRKYFWYAALVKSKTEINSILLDAESGEILAERNNF